MEKIEVNETEKIELDELNDEELSLVFGGVGASCECAGCKTWGESASLGDQVNAG